MLTFFKRRLTWAVAGNHRRWLSVVELPLVFISFAQKHIFSTQKCLRHWGGHRSFFNLFRSGHRSFSTYSDMRMLQSRTFVLSLLLSDPNRGVTHRQATVSNLPCRAVNTYGLCISRYLANTTVPLRPCSPLRSLPLFFYFSFPFHVRYSISTSFVLPLYLWGNVLLTWMKIMEFLYFGFLFFLMAEIMMEELRWTSKNIDWCFWKCWWRILCPVIL